MGFQARLATTSTTPMGLDLKGSACIFALSSVGLVSDTVLQSLPLVQGVRFLSSPSLARRTLSSRPPSLWLGPPPGGCVGALSPSCLVRHFLVNPSPTICSTTRHRPPEVLRALGLTQDLDLPFAIPIGWSDGRVRWLGSRLRQVQFSKFQQSK